jgi:protein-arginine kinase activator protein McsA
MAKLAHAVNKLTTPSGQHLCRRTYQHLLHDELDGQAQVYERASQSVLPIFAVIECSPDHL